MLVDKLFIRPFSSKEFVELSSNSISINKKRPRLDELKIGRFILYKETNYPASIFIEKEGGEGGEFCILAIEALINKYYNDNL